MMLLAAEQSEGIPGGDIHVSIEGWLAFLALIAVLLLIDLFVLNREAHEIVLKRAVYESIGWIALGVSFTFVIWALLGGSAAGQYITGYVIEKSLSVDNVFVWAVIFSYFAVPRMYQHRVLFWGIFGALILRAIFIFAGVALLEAFNWVLYIFGAFLIFTAYRIAMHDVGDIEPEHNPVLKLMRRTLPVTADYHDQRFFWRDAGKRFVTPMFVVLVLIETTDVIFAVDSIPAILAVTRSQFLVFSSNAFAILGLRSLYFVLAGSADRLVYLNKGLGVILAYVGVKMLISEWYHIPTWISLLVITVVLAITVFLSLRRTSADELAGEGATPDDASTEE
jgi:tellurite resistance protein TerC